MEENGGTAAATAATATATVDLNIQVGCGGPEPSPAATIKINVSYGSNHYDVSISPQSTFADLKRVIAETTGLEPEKQNLLFRGKEKDDHEQLHMAGVKDNAKVILMENSNSQEKDLEKVEEEDEKFVEISRGSEDVARVREENDKLAEQVASLEVVVCGGTQVADKDFLFLTEMLMRQLLKLDGIDAEGEGRVQRKMEVRRVQGLVDTLDNLKAMNSNPNGNKSSESNVEGTNVIQ